MSEFGVIQFVKAWQAFKHRLNRADDVGKYPSMNETRKKGKISVSRVTDYDVILASLKDPLVGTFSATIQPWQSILSDEQSINQ